MLKGIYSKAKLFRDMFKADLINVRTKIILDRYNKDLVDIIKEHDYPDWRSFQELGAVARLF
jgi:hypothetical protein